MVESWRVAKCVRVQSRQVPVAFFRGFFQNVTGTVQEQVIKIAS